MTYPKLHIEEFGKQLITTGDLDPVYIALVDMDLHPSQRDRWLISYWCLYHCGLASWISEGEGEEFWHRLKLAADNDTAAPTGGRYPRGSERRHWRGKTAKASVADLEARYWHDPSAMINGLLRKVEDDGKNTISFQEITKRAKSHYGFGEWISFKVADMMERVVGVPVEFENAHIFMFKDPTKAAFMANELLYHFGEDDVLGNVTSKLLDVFADYTAPPGNSFLPRKVNIQEVETVLCKWKSHMNGHYPLFKDTNEILEGAHAWTPYSETAREFIRAMPPKE